MNLADASTLLPVSKLIMKITAQSSFFVQKTMKHGRERSSILPMPPLLPVSPHTLLQKLGYMVHATCMHLTRNGKFQQLRRCWQCKLDPTVVGGGSNLCMLCGARLDKCKCSDNHFASSNQCVENANKKRSRVSRTANTKEMQKTKEEQDLQKIPFCQENEKHKQVSPAPAKSAVCERKRILRRCEHISKQTGRPRTARICWQCKLDPAVVGGGEDLCAKHFQRRFVCGCPTSIENSSQDVVAHTNILLSLHPKNSSSAVQCMRRRQRILTKYGVATLTTGLGTKTKKSTLIPGLTTDTVGE